MHNDNEILAYFRKYFPDIIKLMPNLISEFKENPVGSLVTIRTYPWSFGRMLLIGDAAHAVVPFYGQGMNAAFEDALQLYYKLQTNGDDILKATQFQEERIPAIQALSTLCFAHYEDMASNTTSSLYLFTKKIEKFIQAAFPQTRSLYRMISFTDIPYHKAVDIASFQSRWVKYFVISNIALCTSLAMSFPFLCKLMLKNFYK